MRCFVDRGTEKYNPADLVFNDVSLEVFEKRAVLVGEPGVDTDMNKLADFFFDRHFL